MNPEQIRRARRDFGGHLHIDRAWTIHPLDGIGFERHYSGGQVSHIVVDETHVFAPARSASCQPSRAQVIEGRLAELEAELAELRQFGSDDYDEGTVLTFKGDFGGDKTYAYAAIKAGGSWHLTGAKAPSRLTWDAFVEFMRGANVRKVRRVTGTERVI